MKSLFFNLSLLFESRDLILFKVVALFVDEYCDKSFLDVVGVMFVTIAISFWSFSVFDLLARDASDVSVLRFRFEVDFCSLELLNLVEVLLLLFKAARRSNTVERSFGCCCCDELVVDGVGDVVPLLFDS